MIIKILLLLSLTLASAFAARGRPTYTRLAMSRLVGGLVVLIGAISVLFPSLVTGVANEVGVGRGTDLILYLFVICSLFVWIGVYRRIMNLERRIVRLTRQLALHEAAEDQSLSPPPDRAEKAPNEVLS